MSSTNVHLLPMRTPRVEESRELCIVFSCQRLVCALSARYVERLVLPEEIAVLGRSAGDAIWRLVLVGEQHYAACNLGAHLGQIATDAAWALLRVPHRGAELRIALETGPFLVVQPLGAGTPIPAGAFRARPGTLAAAFPTSLLRSKMELIDVGLRLDLDRFWSEAELDAAAALLGEGA